MRGLYPPVFPVPSSGKISHLSLLPAPPAVTGPAQRWMLYECPPSSTENFSKVPEADTRLIPTILGIQSIDAHMQLTQNSDLGQIQVWVM